MSKIDAVASRLRAVTKSDTTDLSVATLGGAPRALYVGVTGNIKVTGANDVDADAQTFIAVPVGWFPVAVRKVWDATTATNILALYE